MIGVDKVREEFLSEAQEIIETLSRNLLALDETLKTGQSDSGLIQEAFRAVHTLKGLAGLFGATKMGELSHCLEDVLDNLRLGRSEVTTEILDALFATIDIYGQLLQLQKDGADTELRSVDQAIESLRRIGATAKKKPGLVGEYELEPAVLGS